MTNVLLVLADDMRADLLPYAPFLNGVLRPGGTYFSDMQCNVPVCQAARAGILTGQYAHHSANGIYANKDGNIPDPSNDSLPVWLGPVMAKRGMFGKYLLGAQSTVQPGWDTWRVMGLSEQNSWPGGYNVYNGTSSFYPDEPQITYLSGQVKDFITTAPEPWFCYFAPTNPHVNLTFEQNPLPTTMTKYGHIRWDFVIPSAAEMASKPSWMQALSVLTFQGRSALRQAIRQQIREVRDLDDALSGIYATLQTSGRLADTVILFATDSGVHFGEHNYGSTSTSDKNTPYDVSSRVPGIGFGPGFTSGSTVDTMTTLQDLTATIAAICGATPTVPLDGIDLRTLLTNPNPNRSILYERKRDNKFPDCQGIFTQTRKLMRYSGTIPTTGQPVAGTDVFEAYDRDTDPDELVSWGNDGGRIDERNTLEAELDQLLSS
ncbi:MAG TPA: sulfatase-like hydrolase/transferase [Candidatus Saccharimonadales bacterium]|nr:sulfatase-like hydrolase/transferase [Candidatus Saccharimonadales bacterium]